MSGLGVREIAIGANMSPTAVSQFMTGRTSHPHDTTRAAIRRALENQKIQFAPGGWVRHLDDGNGGGIIPDHNVSPILQLEKCLQLSIGLLPALIHH